MSNKAMIVSLLLIVVVVAVGIIWYVFRPGANETEQIVEYVISAPKQTDSSLESQASSGDTSKQQDVMNTDELEALNRMIEILEAMEESSEESTSVEMEMQETVFKQQETEEQEIEESPAGTPSAGDMELAEQQFRPLWEEKIDIGNELLTVLHEYKADYAEILSQPVDSLDELMEVKMQLHEMNNDLGQMTTFFEDDEIVSIMNLVYGGYPDEVQAFLNRVADFERELEALHDN